MLDLNKFDTSKVAEKGFRLVLNHPVSGEKLQAWIELMGKDSSTYQAKFIKTSRELATRKDEMTPSQIRARFLAAATLNWGELADGETAVAYDHDKAVWLYENFAWIAEQVEQGINDRANFMPG